MGQALITVGAVGLGAVSAYGAFKLKAASLRVEPRHAPGNFEAERARKERGEPATAPQHQVLDTPVEKARPDAAKGHGAAGEEPEQLVDVDPERAERARLVRELREVREQKVRARKEWEEQTRRQQDGDRLQETDEKSAHAMDEARRNYPLPTWLITKGCINVAVTGNSGVGKSSFINAARGLRARDGGAADVSPNETTMAPTAYDIADLGVPAKLWDLPGAGTRCFPRETYIQSMGLRYFDVVIIVTASRYTETEIMIAEELRRFSVPHFMVRSKVDADVANNEDDNGASAEETVEAIRADMQRQGVARPYLISSRFSHQNQFDLQRLKADVFVAVCDAREVSKETLFTPRPDCDASAVAVGGC